MARLGENDNRWQDEINVYDVWLVGFRGGKFTEVSANKNAHEVLFVASRKINLPITMIRSVLYNKTLGQRHADRKAKREDRHG